MSDGFKNGRSNVEHVKSKTEASTTVCTVYIPRASFSSPQRSLRIRVTLTQPTTRNDIDCTGEVFYWNVNNYIYSLQDNMEVAEFVIRVDEDDTSDEEVEDIDGSIESLGPIMMSIRIVTSH